MKIKKILMVLFAVFVFFGHMRTAQALTCITLPSDLSLGMRDKVTNGSILTLQKFLAAADYLSATPNGYFGQGTFAAVKNFQSVNNISSTGYVGPLTRTTIQKVSCTTQNVSNQQPNTSTVSTATTLPTPPVIFTSPNPTNVLTLGQTYPITWTGAVSSNYNLVLENEWGVAQGFITAYPSQNKYIWNVGTVTVSSSDSSITVDPGNYRLRFQSKSNGALQSDVKSDLFQIQAPEINVKSLIPTSIPADNKTVAVLYGSGFFGKVSVYLGDVNNQPASVLYTSPDGSIVVFLIPTTVSPGTYPISVTTKYSSIVGSAAITVVSP